MKKKPLTTYPTIPIPKIDQFTLPELINQLFRNKQFTSGIQNLLSNCIITKTPSQQKPITQTFNNKISLNSPTASSKGSNKKQTLLSNSREDTPTSIMSLNSDDQCEFIFQNQVKNRMMYPWNFNENGKQEIVQCKLITDQITDFIQDTIQCSLHKILNKQFINVTNQILAMREQITLFTKQELQRSDNLKNQVNRQVQKMQKKLQQQQHISNSMISQPLEKFARSKGMLNGSLSKNSTKQSNKFIEEDDSRNSSSIHHDVFALRKQVETMKKSFSSNSQFQKSVNTDVIKQMQQKLLTNQQKLNDLTLTLKLSLEEHKQKWKKSYQKLCSELATSSSKQYLTKEVKKTVQSNLKIYLDEIMKCKKQIETLFDRLQRNDKGMQQYIGNQLKNVWTLVSGIKTRVQNIQDQFNVGLDQSFVL